MDHRRFLKSMTAAQRATFTAKSDALGLLHLAAHFGVIGIGAAACLWAVSLGWPIALIIMTLQGILLVFLFTLLHETSHDTPFASLWINRWVGRVCGVILLLPPIWFRYFHFAHHRFTQVPGKDPELDSPKPETVAEYLRHVSGLPIYLSQILIIWRNARGHFDYDYVPRAKRNTIMREARLMIGLYGSLAALCFAFGQWQILVIWLGPMLLGQPFLRLYLMAEHGRCPMVTDMFANTRTVFTHWALRKLAWNMPYHAEHHAWPTVPFHKLGDLHVLTQEHLHSTSNGYAEFHQETLANFKTNA